VGVVVLKCPGLSDDVGSGCGRALMMMVIQWLFQDSGNAADRERVGNWREISTSSTSSAVPLSNVYLHVSTTHSLISPWLTINSKERYELILQNKRILDFADSGGCVEILQLLGPGVPDLNELHNRGIPKVVRTLWEKQHNVSQTYIPLTAPNICNGKLCISRK
jgi:hypothetical protein